MVTKLVRIQSLKSIQHLLYYTFHHAADLRRLFEADTAMNEVVNRVESHRRTYRRACYYCVVLPEA